MNSTSSSSVVDHAPSSESGAVQPDDSDSPVAEPSKIGGWQKYWLKKPVIAGVVFGSVLIGGISDLKDHLWKIFGVDQRNALALQQEGQKAEMSRKLVELAWRRLFWARDYITLRRKGATMGVQDSAWNQYISASAEWNTELMIFINGLEAYYPKAQRGALKKADVFQQHVQPCFNEVGDLLVDLRYLGAEDQNATPTEAEVADRAAIAKANIDALNRTLYFFALDEEQPGNPSSSMGNDGEKQDAALSTAVKSKCAFPYKEPKSTRWFWTQWRWWR